MAIQNKIALKTLTLLLILVASQTLFAQKSDIPEVVVDQFDAFNKGDIERLVNNVTDDFKWFYLSSDTLLTEVEGKEDFKASMKNYFADRIPGFSRIQEYVVDGGRVSFKEVISHKNKEGKDVESSALGIYEVREGKISRAWYFL